MELVLMEASRSGDYSSVSKLPGAQKEDYLLESVTAGKNNVLHIAGKSGNKDFVEGLIASQGNNLSTFHKLLLQPNNRGYTPLHCAANAGNWEFIKLVISKMDDGGIEKRNNNGDTALHLAVNGNSDGHLKVVTLLVERHERLGLERNNSEEYPLYVAAERGELEALRYLLKFPRFPTTGPNGKTALHAAVSRSKGDFFELLLRQRPELLVENDGDGSTPLHYVASWGDEKITHELLSHGDDLFKFPTPEAAENGTLHNRTHVSHISDNEGMSPIHVASVMGHVKVIEEILKSRPDTCELVDKRGRTFLHLAVKHKRTDVVRFVIDSDDRLMKEILNQQDDNGNTPLHLAVRYHHIDIVKVLLKEKEVVGIARNFDGFSPLDLAASDFKSSKMEHRMFDIIKSLIYSKSEFSARRLDRLQDNNKSESQKHEEEEEEAARCRAVADNLTIVSVLIATVTFAAAFTLPGGYKSDVGTAILINTVAFKIFLITDTLAMVTSMAVTYLLVQTRSQDHDIRLQSINTAQGLMKISIGTMAMAFGTGTFAVISSDCQWLAEVIVAMSCVVPLALYTIKIWPSWYHKLQKKCKSSVEKMWMMILRESISKREADSTERRIHRWWPTFEVVRKRIRQREKMSLWKPGSMTQFHSPAATINTASVKTHGRLLKLRSNFMK